MSSALHGPGYNRNPSFGSVELLRGFDFKNHLLSPVLILGGIMPLACSILAMLTAIGTIGFCCPSCYRSGHRRRSGGPGRFLQRLHARTASLLIRRRVISRISPVFSFMGSRLYRRTFRLSFTIRAAAWSIHFDRFPESSLFSHCTRRRLLLGVGHRPPSRKQPYKMYFVRNTTA
jgi:hypothetical protein